MIDTISPSSLSTIFRSGGRNYVGRYTGQFTNWFTVSAAYGVNKNSANLDLAVALATELASAGPIQHFVNDAGVVPANPTVDTAGLSSPSVISILGWMADYGAPTAHANSSPQELEEWHRQSQLLLNGETSVDDAAARLDEVQAQAKPQG